MRVFLYVACVLDGECLASLTELQALGEELGSSTLESMRWTAGLLSRAATMWPLLPNVPRPLAELMSLTVGVRTIRPAPFPDGRGSDNSPRAPP